jgi:hypothetical protein
MVAMGSTGGLGLKVIWTSQTASRAVAVNAYRSPCGWLLQLEINLSKDIGLKSITQLEFGKNFQEVS